MLELAFSLHAGRVRISCGETDVANLQALRSRFPSSLSLSQHGFELELEDLLTNLGELAAWPAADSDVRWQPELRALVLSNHADAATIRSRLAPSGGVDVQHLPLPAVELAAPLTAFQRRDLTALQGLAHGANFSVPGAGKTRVALALFQSCREARQFSRALVVCPKSAFESWQAEVALCFPSQSLRMAVMDGPSPPPADMVLLNYERLPDARSTLLGWLAAQPALLVLDEAHRMKLGPAGAWGGVCMALGPYAARRLILTGTPAPNGARDLENLFSFVWPGLGKVAVSSALVSGDLRAASAALRPLFVRTTKAELQLPPVDLAVRRVSLPPLHRELYRALLGQASSAAVGHEHDIERLGKVLLYLLMAATTPALLAAGASRHEPLPYRIPPLSPPPGSSLYDLMRDLPHYELSPKYHEVLAIVAENAANGRKTLVWSTFVRNLTSLARLLSRFTPAVVHGGTEDRQAQLDRFRNDPSCAVLLSNPATLGEGISLHTVCHDAIYVDRDFAAGRFLQSLDRIHRLGLAPDVVTRITVLVASETVDELVEHRLAVKLRFMGGVLDDPAILELGDLDEEPTAAVGMDSSDLSALVGYLRGDAAA